MNRDTTGYVGETKRLILSDLRLDGVLADPRVMAGVSVSYELVSAAGTSLKTGVMTHNDAFPGTWEATADVPNRPVGEQVIARWTATRSGITGKFRGTITIAAF